MKIPIKDASGAAAGELEFGMEPVVGGRGTQAVHDAVVARLANRRVGTACTKTMGEVAGSGRKPWRQKGTGRARAGSFQSPLWRGGGVVFGPKPRDFGKKVNRTTKLLALRKALTERLQAGDAFVVNELKLAAPKTREFVQLTRSLGLTGTALLVCDPEVNLMRASRNVRGIELTDGRSVSAYQVLKYDHLVFTPAALAELEKRLQ